MVIKTLKELRKVHRGRRLEVRVNYSHNDCTYIPVSKRDFFETFKGYPPETEINAWCPDGSDLITIG